MPRPKQTARKPTANQVNQTALSTSTRGASKQAPPKPAPPVDDPPSPTPSVNSYPQVTDPSKIDRPIEEEIHENLGTAWKVDAGHQMCYIFDTISPARQFKRGMPFDDDKEFADYSPEPWEDLTDTDNEETGWMPFKPVKHTSKYKFKSGLTVKTFMSWAPRELRTIQIGVSKKYRGREAWHTGWTDQRIPAPYDRIVSQFGFEIMHAKMDKSHEARRRESYARRTLDKFGEELMAHEGPRVAFRSKILTPILQRQLRGVTDVYTPALRSAIASGDDDIPTIHDATVFYLAEDPADTELIPNFRRNLIYCPEVRWHLGHLLGHITIGVAHGFRKIRDNQDILAEDMKRIGDNDPVGEEDIPAFTAAEVRVIVDERLEHFFEPELESVPELLQTALAQRAVDDEANAVTALARAERGAGPSRA